MACGFPADWRKVLGALSVSLESLTVTFLKGLCLLEISAEGSHGQQAYEDPTLAGAEARKEKPGKWGLLLGGQRKDEQRSGS